MLTIPIDLEPLLAKLAKEEARAEIPKEEARLAKVLDAEASKLKHLANVEFGRQKLKSDCEDDMDFRVYDLLDDAASSLRGAASELRDRVNPEWESF